MPGLGFPVGPTGLNTNSTSRDKQISPDKNMNCRSTTASFTVSDEPRASLSCANLPTDSAFYDVSVRRLTALLQTSSRPRLATTPLSFASSYSILRKHTGIQLQRTYTSLVHAHAGRTHPMQPTQGATVPACLNVGVSVACLKRVVALRG